jgi:hypothetical protein
MTSTIRGSIRGRALVIALTSLCWMLPGVGAVSAGAAEPVRTFSDEAEQIRVRVSAAANVTGAVSIAALIRPHDLDDHSLFELRTSAERQAGYELWHSENGQLVLWNGRDNAWGTPDPLVANRWRLAVVTKAGGTATPRFHVYDFATDDWEHDDASNAIGDGGSVPGGVIRIGSWNSGHEFAGDYAAAGLWASALTDEQVERLAGSYEAWLALEPAGMWIFNQPELDRPVLDETGGGADEITHSDETDLLPNASPLSGDPDGTIFRGDFHTNDTSQWWEEQEVGEGASVGVASSSPAPPAGETHYGRFELQGGDERAEVYHGMELTEGEDLSFRFLARFGAGFPIEEDQWMLFWQLHQQEGERSPPLALSIQEPNQPDPGAFSLDETEGGLWWEGPDMEEDRWYEFVVRVRHSTRPEVGFVELWLDGVQQRFFNNEFRLYGATLLDEFNYPKAGYYREDDTVGTGVVRIAGYRISKDLEDLP